MCVELGDAMIAQADPEYSRAVIDKEDTSEYRLLPFRSPAAVELMAYGHRLAEERRAEPRDDLVTKLFTRGAVAQYEVFVREQARLVLDRGLPKGEFDFVEEISR